MAFSNRKVGGIRFMKLGRMNLSFSVSKPAPRETKGRTMVLPDAGSMALLAVFAVSALFGL